MFYYFPCFLNIFSRKRHYVKKRPIQTCISEKLDKRKISDFTKIEELYTFFEIFEENGIKSESIPRLGILNDQITQSEDSVLDKKTGT